MARIKKPKGKHRAYPRVPHEAGRYLVGKVLPIPPSVNSIWVRGKWGSYKSKGYCDWERNTLPLFTAKDSFQLQEEVEVQVLVLPGKGWRMNRDIDNILKPILDMLTLANVIKDDNSGIVTSVSIAMSPMSYAQASVQVKVIGWSDGFQEISNSQVKASPSRKAKGNSPSKPRRGSSKGTTLLGPP